MYKFYKQGSVIEELFNHFIWKRFNFWKKSSSELILTLFRQYEYKVVKIVSTQYNMSQYPTHVCAVYS